MKATIRNDAPTAKVRNVDVPSVRSRPGADVLSAGADAISFAGAGFLMGMLALTYSEEQEVAAIPATFRSDDVPIARIRNTD